MAAAIVCCLIVAAVLRVGTLYAQNVVESSFRHEIEPAMLSNPEMLSDDVQSVFVQRFDADAKVILAPGADGQPGQAEGDDDFDGVVDNRSELGAVGSDDLCLAPWNTGYKSLLNGNGIAVVSRGAFVPVAELGGRDGRMPDDRLPSDQETRYLIVGLSQGKAWTRLVLPAPSSVQAD